MVLMVDKGQMNEFLIDLKSFKRYVNVFAHVSNVSDTFNRSLDATNERSLRLEYKGFIGFLETVEKEEADEFFDKGYMTFGDWRLYSDLSIGPVDKKYRQQRLSCTDGATGFGLPYYDRVVQKYLYLKHNPENIIRIGKRHLSHVHDGNYVPTVTVTKDYSEIRGKDDIFEPGVTRLRIKNMPIEHYQIARLYSTYHKYTRRKDIVIIEKGDGFVVSPDPDMFLYFFHYYIAKTKFLCEDGGFEWKKEFGYALESLFADVRKIKNVAIYDWGRSNLPAIKKMLYLPGYVNSKFLEAVVQDAGLSMIITYYDAHPQYISDFKNKKRKRRKKSGIVVRNNVFDDGLSVRPRMNMPTDMMMGAVGVDLSQAEAQAELVIEEVDAYMSQQLGELRDRLFDDIKEREGVDVDDDGE